MVFSHLLALFELPSFQGEVASLRLILKRPFMGDELLRDKHLGDKQFGGKDGDEDSDSEEIIISDDDGQR